MDPALAKEVAYLAYNRAINETIDKGVSDVQRFYKDAVVFITGGSGFLGKQLIEKLFRSCDIKKVYLLMRPKKKLAFHERLEGILQDQVFDEVKKMKPDFKKRIVPVQGDCIQPHLGISPMERAQIISDTQIVFHVAATVSFNEPLKIATHTNIRGTIEVIKLAKECADIKSFVYVSTAYSHATESRIGKEILEDFYEPPLTPQVLLDMVETMDEQRLNDITPDLIQNWPNTYTFTKSIAEEAVRQVAGELPICIVRPAIVIASHLEPTPGWLDKNSAVMGPSGFIVGSAYGMLHTILCDRTEKIDLVPVDLVNNATIVAACETAQRWTSGQKDVKIYTVTSCRNPARWDDIIETLLKCRLKYSSPKALYYSFVMVLNNPILHTIMYWLLHYIPAYFIDAVLYILNKKQIAVRLYARAEKLFTLLSYFTLNYWNSRDNNMLDVYQRLSPSDKVIFNCDLGKIDWKDHCVVWGIGVRKYLMEDGLKDTAYGVKKQKWLQYVHYIVVGLYAYLIWTVLSLTYWAINTAISFVM